MMPREFPLCRDGQKFLMSELMTLTEVRESKLANHLFQTATVTWLYDALCLAPVHVTGTTAYYFREDVLDVAKSLNGVLTAFWIARNTTTSASYVYR